MNLELTTPSILFSAISLMMGAYMVRFSKLYTLIEELTAEYESKDLTKQSLLKEEIILLAKRMGYIRRLQYFAILSLISSTISIFLLLAQRILLAKFSFALAIIFFIICLCLILAEIYYSVKALDINLQL